MTAEPIVPLIPLYARFKSNPHSFPPARCRLDQAAGLQVEETYLKSASQQTVPPLHGLFHLADLAS